MVSTVLGWPSPSTSPEAMETVLPHDPVRQSSKPRDKVIKRRSAAQRSPKSTFKFCTVNHPDGFRDPNQLRENRKHVMRDYLDKERSKPTTKDVRAQNSPSRKRTRHASPLTETHLWPKKLKTRSAFGIKSPASSARQDFLSSASSVMTDNTNESTAEHSTTPYDPPSPQNTSDDDERSLVPGLNRRYQDKTYHNTTLDRIAFVNDRLGSSSKDVFDVWPGFDNPKLEIFRLKLNCNRYLGSKKLGQLWVPLIIKGRHAFVSTCCISTAYDDIMTRAIREPYTRWSPEWQDRTLVRAEVLGMINDAMKDPQQQASDSTIIAVLHVLTAEVMGCDDSVTRVHIDGLHGLLRLRGGLTALGNDNSIPLALTTTMYMIALLRETLPHRGFIIWAKRQKFIPPDSGRPIPESPIFYQKPGFVSVRDALPSGSPILALLNDLREMTDAFHAYRESWSSSSGHSPGARKARLAAVATLGERIFEYRQYPNHEFSKSTDRFRYEAIRLTGRIYAYALSNRVPFSRAAQLMTSSSTNIPGEVELKRVPLPAQIKHNLIRSDLSDGWGPLAGVLLWLALVVGAAANPDKGEFYFALRDTGDEEDRKYMSAIAMRVSILLTFEHGSALVETVKMMSAVQQALIEIEDETTISPMRAAIAGTSDSATFSNYANEFRGLHETLS